jgi:peptide-methionine (R)-S-oxide reductase
MLSRRQLCQTTLGAAVTALGAAVRPVPAECKPASSKETFPVTKSDAEWKKELTPEQFYVLREHGTERAGTSPLDKTYAPGTYVCAGCKTPVFTSVTKFDSGTGWPSFYAPIDKAVETSTDRKFFMTRTEVHCATCGGHLGHVFPDGPQPTGERYCMNGAALKFEEKK